MKPITISPWSFLLGGITVVGLVVVLGSQEITRRTATLIPATAFGDTPINVIGIPDPDEIIVIEEGTPFIVPTGKQFVATALGDGAGWGFVWLQVDGTPGVQDIPSIVMEATTVASSGLSMSPIPPYLVIPANSHIEPISSNTDPLAVGIVFGYLIDE